MLRHRYDLLTPPHSLRRRQQTQSSEAGPHGVGLRSGCTNNMLDLSICHPSRPFSNRFSILTTPSPSFMRPSSSVRDFPVASSRRTRNSRGTKEAKKRRDMRRNRRKLAAQLLDQQISQAVDETLIKFNIPPPPAPPRRALLAPVSVPPAAGLPLQRSVCLPPTPPELPMPDFSAFDLGAFTPFTTSTPPPLRTPTPFRTLPKWCPKIPSLTLGDIWRDSLPIFYDLSYLPEPAEVEPAPQKSEAGLCKDLQVWSPIGSVPGREQSRFFPPRKQLTVEDRGYFLGKKARVRLPPPVGCWLHHPETGDDASCSTPKSLDTETSTAALLADVHGTSLRSTPSHEQNQDLAITSLSSGVKAAHHASVMGHFPGESVADGTTANILRRFFMCAESSDDFASEAELCLADKGDQVNRLPLQYQADQPPYELEGREIILPYVHGNSLTGLSNASETTVVSPSYNQQQFFADSGIGLPVVRLFDDDNVGMNEFTVDHDMAQITESSLAAGVPLPISLPITPPATPPMQSTHDIASLSTISCVVETEHQDSDAHYCSEQALFLQSSVPPAPGTAAPQSDSEGGSIDIAEFLKLGHAKQCWCGYCNDKTYDRTTGQANISCASSATLTDQTYAGDKDNDSTLSLIIHPSECDSDTDSEAPELLDLIDGDTDHAKCETGTIEAVEDDEWLLFSPATPLPSGASQPSSSPVYLPSSPILHRQRQQKAAAPSIVITASGTSADDRPDDYVAVPPLTVAGDRTAPAWHDMFPRRPSSAWEAGLARFGDEGIGCGFAKAMEGSWRWGRESEEEWWDWAVEEEC